MSPIVKTCRPICFSLALFAVLIIATTGRAVLAQQTSADTRGPAAAAPITATALPAARIDEIIRAFTAKESRFRQALNSYAFKRDALVQTIGMGGQVTGEYHRVSYFTFDDAGNRFEKINFFPMPTMTEITITAQDLEDLGGVNPFALEASKLNAYNFKYVGKEKIDELDLYVFDVGPKVAPDPKKIKERFFQGRIWVDQQDLQIVKARGKGVPEDKNNKYPTFETYREQIDGKYWFPTYVYADDDIVFDNGSDLRIRMRVKYTDFVVGRGRVTITEVGDAPETDTKPSPPPPTQTPAKPEVQPTSSGTPTTTTKPATSDPSAEEKFPAQGGFMNGKAVDLPKADYPEEARKASVSGTVQVQILVDETGKVVSAVATFGPEALRAAATKAALRAKFKPMIVDGAPVKVTGILTYDFTPQ